MSLAPGMLHALAPARRSKVDAAGAAGAFKTDIGDIERNHAQRGTSVLLGGFLPIHGSKTVAAGVWCGVFVLMQSFVSSAGGAVAANGD